jgi:hypothetical protein
MIADNLPESRKWHGLEYELMCRYSYLKCNNYVEHPAFQALQPFDDADNRILNGFIFDEQPEIDWTHRFNLSQKIDKSSPKGFHHEH